MDKAIRCPICGKRVSNIDAYCQNCKNPLVSGGSTEECRIAARKQILYRSFLNVFIFGIILAVVWEVLTHFVPTGWPMAVLNIITFIVSLWIFWWPLFSYMKVTMPTWLATLASVLCWTLLFIGIRSLIGFIF